MAKEKIVIGASDALIIIDMQKDFTNPDGRLFVSGVDGESTREEVIANIIKLGMAEFGYEVMTFDNHPPEDVGHIEYEIFGGPHCETGTDGQRIVDELMIFSLNIDYFLSKGQNPAIISYSVATGMKDYEVLIATLRQSEIKRCFVVGLAYTHCVGESAIALSAQGFETFVVRDATRSVPVEIGKRTVADMNMKLQLDGVKLVNMADFAL